MAAPSRAETLSALHLKTIVKARAEHHGQPPRQLVFNTVDADKRNLFASVASNQATIYDNEHFGSFVSVVEQFVNTETEHTKGGELHACCWMPSVGTRQEHGDGVLAVGGADNAVSVISMASSAVVSLLKGHTQAIMDVAATSARPELVASVAKDGTVRVWHAASEKCVAALAAPTATTIAFREDGAALFVGCNTGAMLEWPLPAAALQTPAASAAEPAPCPASAAAQFPSTPAGHGCRVDSVLALPGGVVASKSADGRVVVWDATSKAQRATWRVPGCTASDGTRGRVGTTPDGCVLVAGSASGEVFAFDTATGAKLASLSARKVRAPVLACAITDDCRTVLASLGTGIIARWELITVGATAMAAADDDE